ncbi:MAG: VCBS domain-containing protein, partial [Planctomycetota bacterium]
TVRATSADGSWSTQTFTINLTDVDEFDVGAVTDSNAAANSLAENSANGTAVGLTASASDADGTTNTITYTLDDAAGGRFAINSSTGVVTVANSSLLNYEAATSHSITVRATSADGSWSTQSFTISLTDVDEFDVGPVTDTNAAANSLAENSANGTLVGITASASDADATTNTITYTLDDAAGGRFTINSSTGVVTVADGSLLNYEAATGHSITVRATSADGSWSIQTFTISLTDVDEFDVGPVTDTNAAANSLAENSANGIAVGITAAASDADATNNIITYSLDDTSGGRFAINSSTGVVTVANGSLLNYEAATSHSITVRATSADGSWSTQTFTINLTDIDEFDVGPVTDVDAAANSLAENSTNGTAAGITASASDADGSTNTIIYTLDDTAGGRFAINSSTGVVTVADSSLLDREAAASHSITVRATSADGSWSTQTFTINLTDVDEFDVGAVTDGNAAANSLAENSANGTTVGLTASASDADATTNTITYTLDDTAGGRFAINSSTGVVTVANSSLLDFDTIASHTITVRATSADGSWSTQTFTISLTNVNESPTAVADTATAVEAGGFSNGTAGTNPSGNVLTNDTDPDAVDTKTVTGVAAGTVGSASGNVASNVTGTYGSVTIAADGTYTYTVDNNNAAVQALRTIGNNLTDTFTYTMRDASGLTSTTQLSVTIQGSNDNPHDLATAGLSTAENSSVGTIAGTISSSDFDFGDSASFTLVNNAGGRFAINASTGAVTVANPALLNYEVATSHIIRVRITDTAGATYEEDFVVNLTDVDEFDVGPLTDSNAAADSLAENSSNGSLTGITALASDADATNNTITYSLDDSAGGRFTINASTGVVTVANSSLLNYEDNSSHQVTIRATSADGSFSTETFIIQLTDVDEFDVGPVSDADSATNHVNENSSTGTVVGLTASASDLDGTNNQITYSLDDDAGGRFAIDSSTGVVTVADGSLLDFESSTSHTVIVRATSGDNSFSIQTFTIDLLDIPEPPNPADDVDTAIEAGGLLNDIPGLNPTGNVLANDTDTDAGETKVVIGVVAGPASSASGFVGTTVLGAYGSVTIQADGTYVYILNNSNAAVQALRTSGQTLKDIFTYTMQDSAALASTARLTITIQGANDTPTAVVDSNIAVEAGGLSNGSSGTNPTGNVLTNDTDVDAGDTKTVIGVEAGVQNSVSGGIASSITGSYGSIVINANGSYTYTVDNSNPAVQALRISGETLTDTFTYTMRDAGGLESTAQVTITVRGANDTPTAVADANTATEAGGLNNDSAGTNPSGNVLSNDTDVDAGDSQTVVGVQAGVQGSTSGNVGASVRGLYGWVTISSNGEYTYTVDNSLAAVQALRISNQTLSDTFSYTFRDTGGLQSTTQLTITIQGENDTPTAVADTNIAVEAGGLSNGTVGVNPTGNVLVNDTDVDQGDSKTVVGVQAGVQSSTSGDVSSNIVGDYGSIIIGSDGSYIYTVDNNNPAVQALRTSGQTLTDTFSYTIRDTEGLESTTQITITIQGANDTPTAVADTDTAVEAGGLNNGTSGANSSGNVLVNDTDVDAGDTKTIVGVRQGTYSSATGSVGSTVIGSFGSLVLQANGNYAYTADNNNPAVQALRLSGQTLTDTFTYTMRDTGGLQSTTQLSITISGVNDTPVAIADLALANEAGGFSNGTAGLNPSGNVLANDTDVDAGDSLTVVGVQHGNSSVTSGNVASTVSGNYGSLVLNADGSYVYTVDNEDPAVQALRTSGQTLSDTFSYTIRDSEGLESTVQLTVVIRGANDTPVANSDEDTAVEASGDGNQTSGSNPIGNLLENDTDIDSGDTKTVIGVAAGIQTSASGFSGDPIVGQYGTLVVDANGDYLYLVNNSHPEVQALQINRETLTDTFTYTMQDAGGLQSTAQLTITVRGRNETPTAQSDTAIAMEAGGLLNSTPGIDPSGNVLANDYDMDFNDTLEVAGVVAGVSSYAEGGLGTSITGTYGTLTLNADGTYQYVVFNNHTEVEALQNSSQTLADTFTYTIRDASGAESTTQLVVTILGANDTPQSSVDTFKAVQGKPLVTVGSVLGNDIDLDESPMIAILLEGPRFGKIVFQADGKFIYEPDRGFIGTDLFTYTTTDGELTGVVTTVEIVVDVGSTQDTSNSNSNNLLIATQDGSLVAATGTGQTQDANRGGLFEKKDSERPDTATESALDAGNEQEGGSQSGEEGDRFEVERQVMANLLDLREQLGKLNGNDAAHSILNSSLELNGQTYKVAVNLNKVWQQFADIEQNLKQRGNGNGLQAQEIGIDVNTFTMAASLGTILWFLRGGAMMATLMTQVPTWKMIDPLVVMDSYSSGMDDAGSDEMNSYFDK